MIKDVKLVELHTKYATVFLNTQNLKLIKWNTNVVTKIISNLVKS